MTNLTEKWGADKPAADPLLGVPQVPCDGNWYAQMLFMVEGHVRLQPEAGCYLELWGTFVRSVKL